MFSFLTGGKKNNDSSPRPGFKTTIPKQQVTLEKWKEEFKVGKQYSSHEPVHLADITEKVDIKDLTKLYIIKQAQKQYNHGGQC